MFAVFLLLLAADFPSMRSVCKWKWCKLCCTYHKTQSTIATPQRIFFSYLTHNHLKCECNAHFLTMISKNIFRLLAMRRQLSYNCNFNTVVFWYLNWFQRVQFVRIKRMDFALITENLIRIFLYIIKGGLVNCTYLLYNSYVSVCR